MPQMPGPQDDWASWDGATRPMPPDRAYTRAALPPIPSAEGRQGRVPPQLQRQTPPPVLPPSAPSRIGRPPTQPPRRRNVWRWVRLGLLAALVLVLVLGGLALHSAYAFGQAISAQTPFSTQTGYMSGANRVNLLVMGYGGGSHDGADLTDSMMVISVVPSTGATTMISVPRDLWVQVPPSSGQYQKLNTAYQDGLDNGFNGLHPGPLAGGAEATAKVSEITGLDVHYWMTIDFQGFRSLVDALGGVDINVKDGFNACYPKNDDAAVDPSWIKVQFNPGLQHMNGERAIEYARAREPLEVCGMGTSENQAELSDFARSARQQVLIRAIISRARQVSAWPGLNNAMKALQKAIYTNLSLADLALFSMKMDFSHGTRIGLTNDNVLTDAQANGQDILLPRNGDWNAIKQYIASNLKS